VRHASDGSSSASFASAADSFTSSLRSFGRSATVKTGSNAGRITGLLWDTGLPVEIMSPVRMSSSRPSATTSPWPAFACLAWSLPVKRYMPLTLPIAAVGGRHFRAIGNRARQECAPPTACRHAACGPSS
jgi:hypothetical protein